VRRLPAKIIAKEKEPGIPQGMDPYAPLKTRAVMGDMGCRTFQEITRDTRKMS
jgi:hypothetical protein